MAMIVFCSVCCVMGQVGLKMVLGISFVVQLVSLEELLMYPQPQKHVHHSETLSDHGWNGLGEGGGPYS